MGGLSFWHIAVIAVVALVAFAHRHIPAVLGALGTAIGRLRRPAAPRHKHDKTIEGTFERRD